METYIITCSNCNAEIELTEALTGKIEKDLTAEYDSKIKEKEKELVVGRKKLEKKENDLLKKEQNIDSTLQEKLDSELERISVEARKKANEVFSLKLKFAEDELEEKQKKIDEVTKRELELLKKEKNLREKEKELELENEKKIQEAIEKREKELKSEQKRLVEKEKDKIANKVQSEYEEKLKEANDELEEKDGKLKELQKMELGLRKEQKKLEEEKDALELKTQRKIDEARKKIIKETSTKNEEQHRLKMREKEDLITDLQVQLKETQIKIEQGSQESQGEALENELAEILQREFPFDKITEIKKGTRGADILQEVKNKMGKPCGSILWESKNTKVFNKTWIDKLKKDQQAKKTEILPKVVD